MLGSRQQADWIVLRRRRAGTSNVVPIDLVAAAKAYLGGSSYLSAVGSRIYFGNIPQNPAYPFIVISDLGAIPDLNSSGSWQEPVRLQYTVISDVHDDCETYTWTAIGLLRNSATNAPLVFQRGSEAGRLVGRHRVYPGPGPTATAMVVWHGVFDVVHLVNRGFDS